MAHEMPVGAAHPAWARHISRHIRNIVRQRQVTAYLLELPRGLNGLCMFLRYCLWYSLCTEWRTRVLCTCCLFAFSLWIDSPELEGRCSRQRRCPGLSSQTTKPVTRITSTQPPQSQSMEMPPGPMPTMPMLCSASRLSHLSARLSSQRYSSSLSLHH
jgi:hypothetical protein